MEMYLYRGRLYDRDSVLEICRDLAAHGYHAIKAERPELTYDSDVFPQRAICEDGGAQ